MVKRLRIWRLWAAMFVFAFLFSPLPRSGVGDNELPPIGNQSVAAAAAHDGEEEEDDVNARVEWFYGQRAAPLTEIPDGAFLRARQQAQSFSAAAQGQAT